MLNQSFITFSVINMSDEMMSAWNLVNETLRLIEDCKRSYTSTETEYKDIRKEITEEEKKITTAGGNNGVCEADVAILSLRTGYCDHLRRAMDDAETNLQEACREHEDARNFMTRVCKNQDEKTRKSHDEIVRLNQKIVQMSEHPLTVMTQTPTTFQPPKLQPAPLIEEIIGGLDGIPRMIMDTMTSDDGDL